MYWQWCPPQLLLHFIFNIVLFALTDSIFFHTQINRVMFEELISFIISLTLTLPSETYKAVTFWQVSFSRRLLFTAFDYNTVHYKVKHEMLGKRARNLLLKGSILFF